ncbi:MAG TPA: MmcQ/YjbR family DNA-binding protein [Bacteroidales bacterium]|nr:MmcQ/YjbR family DNA-binding protein [Bacteroidales bacterium]
MDVDILREYCLSKPAVTESFPFDETTLVFKVLDKMFMLMNLEGDLSINLKCDPVKAIEYREKFPAVQPGYHMSNKHWNTIYIDGSIPGETIFHWIDNSYTLVVAGMPSYKRKQLQ